MNWFNKLLQWQKIIIVCLGIFLCFYVFIKQGISPKLNQMKDIKAKILKAEQELFEAKCKQAELKMLQRKYDKLKKELEVAKQRLPYQKNIPEVLQNISILATLSGIELISFQPGDISSKLLDGKPVYLELSINLEIRGRYHTLGIFLDKIANLSRIVTVESICIIPLITEKEKGKISKETNTIKVTMKLKVFMSVKIGMDI